MRDPDKFFALLAPHWERLHAISRRLLRRKADADDAVQEALLNAWRDFPNYREGSSFLAWIIQCLVNEVRNRNRLLHQELEVALPAELEDPETLLDWEAAYENFFEAPEIVLETLEERLAEAIGGLPPAERLVLLLRCVGELSYREIAETLRMPEGTAMSHLSRARKHLRVFLSGKLKESHGGQGTDERGRP